MQTTPHLQPTADNSQARADFEAAVNLASLFQRVEGSLQGVSPEQYQKLAQQLGTVLQALRTDERLHQLLNRFPAASDVYENGRYQLAGLCRSPLEQSLAGEAAARAAIDKARTPRT